MLADARERVRSYLGWPLGGRSLVCVAWGLAYVDHTSQVWFSASPDIARGLLPIPAIDNAKAAMHGIAYYWYCQFTARQLLLSSRNRYAAVIQHGVKQDTSSDR